MNRVRKKGAIEANQRAWASGKRRPAFKWL